MFKSTTNYYRCKAGQVRYAYQSSTLSLPSIVLVRILSESREISPSATRMVKSMPSLLPHQSINVINHQLVVVGTGACISDSKFDRLLAGLISALSNVHTFHSLFPSQFSDPSLHTPSNEERLSFLGGLRILVYTLTGHDLVTGPAIPQKYGPSTAERLTKLRDVASLLSRHLSEATTASIIGLYIRLHEPYDGRDQCNVCSRISSSSCQHRIFLSSRPRRRQVTSIC